MIFGYFLESQKIKRRQKKKQNETIIKDKIDRDIKAFLGEEEEYYEPIRVSDFQNKN